MLDVAFARPSLPKSGALALLAGEGEAPSEMWRQADEATGGAISRAADAASFKAAKGKTCSILAPGGGLSRVLLVGLGKAGELTVHALEEAGGHAAASLTGDAEAAIAGPALAPAQAASVAFGAVLRRYRFDRYRTKEKPEDKPKLAKITVLTEDAAAAEAAWASRQAVARGVFLTRDLVSEPPNVLNPAEMAERCRALEELGIRVEVLGPKEMRELGFGALLGVAQGSANEPRVVVMEWRGGSGDDATSRSARLPSSARV